MTRTKALLVVLVFLALSAGYADVRVFVLTGRQESAQLVDTSALCSLRADVRERVASTIDFLKAHPHGIPGVPAGAILVGLNNEQHTLYALHPLAGHCQRR